MKKLKLITEQSKTVDVGRNIKGTKVYVEGVYSTAGVMNHNNRIYSKRLLEREVNNFQEKIQKKMAWGQLNHPTSIHSDPEKIAILTTKLEMRGNDVWGRSKVLDTPSGQIVKSILKEGNFGISSRGVGTVNQETQYVNDDYQLIAYDLVTDSSNPSSYVNGVYEDKSWSLCEVRELLQESDDEDTSYLSQTGFDYHFFYFDDTPRYTTECKCSKCNDTMRVPEGMTCKDVLCVNCDIKYKVFNEMTNIWIKKIKERGEY